MVASTPGTSELIDDGGDIIDSTCALKTISESTSELNVSSPDRGLLTDGGGDRNNTLLLCYISVNYASIEFQS